MGTNYEHLTAEERATLMVMRADGCSQRAVARCLGRSPSTISRELARNASCGRRGGDTTAVIPYDASLAARIPAPVVRRRQPQGHAQFFLGVDDQLSAFELVAQTSVVALQLLDLSCRGIRLWPPSFWSERRLVCQADLLAPGCARGAG